MSTAVQIFVVLSCVALCSSQLIPGSLDWCTYWRQLGVTRPECPPIYPQPPTYLPTCIVSVMTACKSNFNCASGSSCMQNGQPCCSPLPIQNDEVCPTVVQLGIVCNKTNPTNWCNNNEQCHTAPKKLCCPTGCNYNICVQAGIPTLTNGQDQPTVDPACPFPDQVEVMCEKMNPTAWCTSQEVCLDRNSAQERRCCPTKCNYSVCMLNYNGRWIIA